MHREVIMTHRGLTLRVHPGSKAKHDQMLRTAGACRRVWNEALAICKQQYQNYKEGKADKPSVTSISLCKLYVQLKQALPWLRELLSDTVRHTLKHWTEAYKRFLAGAGFPNKYPVGHCVLWAWCETVYSPLWLSDAVCVPRPGLCLRHATVS